MFVLLERYMERYFNATYLKAALVLLNLKLIKTGSEADFLIIAPTSTDLVLIWMIFPKLSCHLLRLVASSPLRSMYVQRMELLLAYSITVGT